MEQTSKTKSTHLPAESEETYSVRAGTMTLRQAAHLQRLYKARQQESSDVSSVSKERVPTLKR